MPRYIDGDAADHIRVQYSVPVGSPGVEEFGALDRISERNLFSRSVVCSGKVRRIRKELFETKWDARGKPAGTSRELSEIVVIFAGICFPAEERIIPDHECYTDH